MHPACLGWVGGVLVEEPDAVIRLSTLESVRGEVLGALATLNGHTPQVGPRGHLRSGWPSPYSEDCPVPAAAHMPPQSVAFWDYRSANGVTTDRMEKRTRPGVFQHPSTVEAT